MHEGGLNEIGIKEKRKWIHEGLITESLPRGMFQVPLYNENRILGYVSERIRRTLILYVYERESKNGSISHLIRLFFQLQHFFWGGTIISSKFKETIFSSNKEIRD
uniref:InfA protein n=1 Tax=Ormosia sericeolucida TaxID=2929555 RepID=A0A8S0NJ35_9FABA|nr:translation initiation factor 1 [Ormosia sericeolucida]BDH72761.1 infA [Ormosia sericeolucida]